KLHHTLFSYTTLFRSRPAGVLPLRIPAVRSGGGPPAPGPAAGRARPAPGGGGLRRVRGLQVPGPGRVPDRGLLGAVTRRPDRSRSEEHTSELQSRENL